jgi:Toprim domain
MSDDHRNEIITINPDPAVWAELEAFINAPYTPPSTGPHPPEETPLQEAGRRLRPVVNKLRWSVAASPDTVSGRYLKSRGIDRFPLPSTVRHWSWQNRHALIGIFTNQHDTITALNVVHLNPDATNVTDEFGDKVKRTPGFTSGSRIVLSGPQCGILVICEGLETGLSVWMCVPDVVGVWCVGGKGNLIAPIPDYVHTVVLARDNDDEMRTDNHGNPTIIRNIHNGNAYRKAAWHYRRKFHVRVPMPETAGHDMNDVLRDGGGDRVLDLLSVAKGGRHGNKN